MLAISKDTEKREINAIQFNYWPQTPNTDEFLYDEYTVGNIGVTEIREHWAQGEGDKWFYDVYFNDGRIERIFNVHRVFYKAEIKKEDCPF